jgi:hypothetical protein
MLSFALFAALCCSRAFAGADHDHGPAKTQAAGGPSPRIALHTELFELVGIVEAGEMTIYLDRYADNAPITDARIDIESGELKASATAKADGTFAWKSELLSKGGELPLTFTVVAARQTDLLAGTLELPAGSAAGDPHGHDHGASWWRWLGGAVGAAILLLLFIALRRAARRAAAEETS